MRTLKRGSYLRAILLAALVLGNCPGASADTVHLKKGGTIEGEVVERESTIEVRMIDGSTTFNKEDISGIEKNQAGTGGGAVLGSLDRFKKSVKRSFDSLKHQTDKSLQGLKKKSSGWMQPIGKAKSATAKEKALNDNMNEMQQNLKKIHARDQAIAKEKRALKKEGFDI